MDRFFRNVACCLLFVSGMLYAHDSRPQNLIPDSGFELLSGGGCTTPDAAINQSVHWYPLSATPDLFKGGCKIDPNLNYFWDPELKPFEGRNFAGLSSRWNSNATYISEGIAVELNAPLEAGRVYLLQMAVRNLGGYQGFADSLVTCRLDPDQHIDIYLSDERIEVVNDFSNGTSSTNAVPVAKFDSDPIRSLDRGSWTLVITCFVAKGNERHLGLMMPLGTFGSLPACAGMSGGGVFRTFYFLIDEVLLTPLPEIEDVYKPWCPDASPEVDLNDLLLDLSFPASLKGVWKDGFPDIRRTIAAPGVYEATIELPCTTLIPRFVFVEEVCRSSVFVPDAFSPNQDNVNDYFRAYTQLDLPILHYKMRIYNRWGGLVFESASLEEPWSGETKGIPAPEGVYFWQLEITVKLGEGSREELVTGAVSLIR